jgi:hypothetical protein
MWELDSSHIFFLVQLIPVINLKLFIMDASTLINVVAMIDARINMYQRADLLDPFYVGAITSLQSLSEELQGEIEAAIAAMESNTGE